MLFTVVHVRQAPLRAVLCSGSDGSNGDGAAKCCEFALEPSIAPFVAAVQSLTDSGDSHLASYGPHSIRQILIPLCVRERIAVPTSLLGYVDIARADGSLSDTEDEQFLHTLLQRVTAFSQDDVCAAFQQVTLGVESAVCDRDTTVAENTVVRARGLPWTASDADVAQFFAGLNIAPGGIALCLSSEGRRNGEALVCFQSTEHRDLALKRHRHFLLSRYIEVYKANAEEFLQVAAGVSSEALSFVSTGAAMIVRMRGLPYDCSEQQIREFFAREPESCEVMEKILFVTRNDGRPTGDAFVQFADEETALRALKSKHRDTIGARYVELFRSTNAEVQQVVKRSSEGVQSNRRDCVRLRGLPFEAHVQHVVEFLGEHARNIVYQGVHMVFNSQGHPSGEAFIQMSSEAAASSASQCAHNKFMQIGKKTRYIEVFQCSPEDMHLVMAPSCPPAPQPAVVVPQRPLLPNVSGLPAPAIFWPYPSPPMSPNMLLPGQINQMIVYGIGPTVGVPELIAHFQTPEVVVENVTFTRIAQAGIPGEAIITLRSRSPSDPPIVPLDQYLINKQVSLENFVPVPPALVPQIYTVIPSQ